MLLNGRDDFIFPLDSIAKPLFALLGAPPDRKNGTPSTKGAIFPPLNELIRDVLGLSISIWDRSRRNEPMRDAFLITAGRTSDLRPRGTVERAFTPGIWRARAELNWRPPA